MLLYYSELIIIKVKVWLSGFKSNLLRVNFNLLRLSIVATQQFESLKQIVKEP